MENSSLKIVDNVFVKVHVLANNGDIFPGHSHTFDHITLLATGKVLVKHDNGEQEFTAPHLIVVPKTIVHQFIALEPNTMFCCIHAIRDGSDVDDVASQDISVEEAWNLLSKYPLTS